MSKQFGRVHSIALDTKLINEYGCLSHAIAGNDFAARDACPTIWITNPTETKYILKKVLMVLGVSTKEDNADGGPAQKKARRA
jgi:hypothetical protein